MTSADSDTGGVEPITEALVALRSGEPGAMNRLMPLVYDQLRRIAHRQLSSEATGHTLSTDGVVHEAYLKLVDQTRVEWQDQAHFFSVAATVMRRVLIEYARRANAARRGGGMNRPKRAHIELGDVEIPIEDRAEVLVDLDEALERLAAVDARLARIVECRFFAGLTESETATALSISQRTVAREWVVAKAWLFQELRDAQP